MRNRLMYLTFAFVALVANVASAQTSPNTDARFRDYPIKLRMPAPGAVPDLAACKAGEYYVPADKHLLPYAKFLHGVKEAPLPEDTCVIMTTANGPRSVMLKKGTMVGMDAQGHPIYCADCGNPIFVAVPMTPPAPARQGLIDAVLPPVLVPGPAPATPIAPIRMAARMPDFTPAPATVPAAVEAAIDQQLITAGAIVAAPTPKSVQITGDVVPDQKPGPAPAQTTAPVQSRQITDADRDYAREREMNKPAKTGQPSRWSVITGVDYGFGTANSTYESASKNSGDVPQRHNFVEGLPWFQFAPTGNGLFGFARGSAFASTSGQDFQDVTGAWVGKKRNPDNSKDSLIGGGVGYSYAFSRNFGLRGSVGYGGFCLCENYYSGVQTVTERRYNGAQVGVEAIGSAGHHQAVTVTVSGMFSPWATRSSFTRQTGFTPPPTAYESAKTYDFGIRASFRIFRGLRGDVGYDYLLATSTRPNTFTAHERVNMPSFLVGISYRVELGHRK